MRSLTILPNMLADLCELFMFNLLTYTANKTSENHKRNLITERHAWFIHNHRQIYLVFTIDYRDLSVHTKNRN